MDELTSINIIRTNNLMELYSKVHSISNSCSCITSDIITRNEFYRIYKELKSNIDYIISDQVGISIKTSHRTSTNEH